MIVVYQWFRKRPYACNEWHLRACWSVLTNGRIRLTFHQSEHYSYNYLLASTADLYWGLFHCLCLRVKSGHLMFEHVLAMIGLWGKGVGVAANLKLQTQLNQDLKSLLLFPLNPLLNRRLNSDIIIFCSVEKALKQREGSCNGSVNQREFQRHSCSPTSLSSKETAAVCVGLFVYGAAASSALPNFKSSVSTLISSSPALRTRKKDRREKPWLFPPLPISPWDAFFSLFAFRPQFFSITLWSSTHAHTLVVSPNCTHSHISIQIFYEYAIVWMHVVWVCKNL